MTDNSKLDLYKLHKADYAAGKKPKLVTIQKAQYLTIDGQGAPGAECYSDAVAALYAIAYTLKFASKADGRDFVVCKLEASYGTDGPIDPDDRDSWTWRLMIRVPDFVSAKHLGAAKEKVESKGQCVQAGLVQLCCITPGTCVQMLHVGPYAEEAATIELMESFAATEGFDLEGHHHEVYLSDPRRVEPLKLKTILRLS